MTWQSRGVGEDADIAPCARCGTNVVLDHDPRCDHGVAACPGCGHDTACPDCAVAS